MTRVYIAGPMRGRPEGNRPAFRAAETALKAAGHAVVWNPARVADRDGGPADRMRAMRTDLGVLTETRGGSPLVEAVVLLDGWLGSDGARAEAAVARALGIPAVPIGIFMKGGASCLRAW